jgi:hypothetical protein
MVHRHQTRWMDAKECAVRHMHPCSASSNRKASMSSIVETRPPPPDSNSGSRRETAAVRLMQNNNSPVGESPFHNRPEADGVYLRERRSRCLSFRADRKCAHEENSTETFSKHGQSVHPGFRNPCGKASARSA